MNSVVDGLRQTAKGQLVYTREIGGNTLTALLNQCASVPALSSPHSEKITVPPPLGHGAGFGLSYSHEEEQEEGEEVAFLGGLQGGRHQCGRKNIPHSCGEKGEQDSLEKENSFDGQFVDNVFASLGVNIREGHVHSPQSPKISVRSGVSPQNPQCVSPPKSPQSDSPYLQSLSFGSPTKAVFGNALQGKSPNSSQIVSPQNNSQVASPESGQILSPKPLQVVSHKSKKSPQVLTLSPKSPPVSSPGSWRQVVIPEPRVSSSASVRSPPLAQKDAEDHPASGASSPGEQQHIARDISLGQGDAEPREEEEEEEDTTAEDCSLDELTVSFTEKLYAITTLEMGYDNRSRELMERKQQEFLQHQTNLDSQREEVVSVVEQLHHHNISILHDSIEKTPHFKREEMAQVAQKVRETHEHCSRRQDARLKQVELLSQHLLEEKAKKEQALDRRLHEIRAVAQKLSTNRATLLGSLEQCPHKQHLSEGAEKTKLLARRLAEQAEGLVSGLTRSGPLEEVYAKLKQFHEQSQNALDFVNNMTAEAERKAKGAAEAEKQRQQQVAAAAAAAQVPQVGQGSVSPQGAQASATTAPPQITAGEEGALAAVAKEYEHNVKLLSQMDAVLDPFISNQQMKKVRFDLQRAVNTPVNAISPVSSGHLRDKLQRLRSLLQGDCVEVLGRQVAATQIPQGLDFCKNLVAKMIARKADEQVSSSHESAFAIAAVAVGLWVEFPDVGQLIMAHLQALCPYVLPFYPPRLPNQSSEEYHRTLGYKVTDNNVEQQDKFLRRMSGVLRLYAAIMVTPPPQAASRNHPHPHGLEHAWVWLARSMNLQPNPDITATAIYDMLQVTGSFLLKAYRVQFVKLIYFLFKVFLPKLKGVAAGSGPVIRLETFLETTMRNSALIPEPEGYLGPRFWNY